MPLPDPVGGHCVTDSDPRMSEAERLRLIGEQYGGPDYLASVLADPALGELKDGPAKAFLTRLSTELDYDEGESPPQLIVRRAGSGMNYQAAYVALREAVVALIARPPNAPYRMVLDRALNAADAAGAAE